MGQHACVLIEVICESARDAEAAAAGGADRIEALGDLAAEGLSPAPGLVRAMKRASRLPVRVMLRHRPDLRAGEAADVERLADSARAFIDEGADGVVLGFIDEGTTDLDYAAMASVLAAVPGIPATCHRAFEWSGGRMDTLSRLAALLPQVDRVMTSGAEGGWAQRVERLEALQAATPLTILPAGGIDAGGLSALRRTSLREVHLGIWVRTPQHRTGRVAADRVRAARQILESDTDRG